MLKPDFNPFPEVKTNRLLLRRVTLEDVSEILYLRSNKETMQYIDREFTTTPDEAATFIQQIDESITNNDSILWGIVLSEEPSKLIGTIGIWRIIKEHYRAEIGYMLHPGFWRKGIMKEALLATLEYGFNTLMLHSIEARINPLNKSSEALLISTGFIKEAYFKEDYFFRGKFGDTAVYSKLK